MLRAIATQLALVLAVCSAFFIGPGIAVVFLTIRRKRRRALRRSPIGIDLLRGPGHTVRERLEEATNDLTWDLVLLCSLPLLLLSLYLAQIHFEPASGGHAELILAIFSIAFIAWMIRKMVKSGARIDDLRNGFDAELAVGQELDQLMRAGASVFHDFPADGFNIDHIVIAPQGVFAVETKGYTKTIPDGGKVNARVVFDGRVLKFPTWTTAEPLEQAERQAKWLSVWAASAVGEVLAVTPVLALPGWFVERTGRSPVRVFSGKALKSLLNVRAGEPLSPELVQRIAHQVEQRCRTVVPTYRRSNEHKRA